MAAAFCVGPLVCLECDRDSKRAREIAKAAERFDHHVAFLATRRLTRSRDHDIHFERPRRELDPAPRQFVAVRGQDVRAADIAARNHHVLSLQQLSKLPDLIVTGLLGVITADSGMTSPPKL